MTLYINVVYSYISVYLIYTCFLISWFKYESISRWVTLLVQTHVVSYRPINIFSIFIECVLLYSVLITFDILCLVWNSYKLLNCGVCYYFIQHNNNDYLLATRANTLTNDSIIRKEAFIDTGTESTSNLARMQTYLKSHTSERKLRQQVYILISHSADLIQRLVVTPSSNWPENQHKMKMYCSNRSVQWSGRRTWMSMGQDWLCIGIHIYR